MIEKRLVQWYAADAGVDLDIAEREVTLTYVLGILSDQGLLRQMAFKGGTALRKIHLGATGRFSLDLDFTATDMASPDAFVLDLVGTVDGRPLVGSLQLEANFHSQRFHSRGFGTHLPTNHPAKRSRGLVLDGSQHVLVLRQDTRRRDDHCEQNHHAERARQGDARSTHGLSLLSRCVYHIFLSIS